jgi:Ricin-type beta-trefoil lectin domain-like
VKSTLLLINNLFIHPLETTSEFIPYTRYLGEETDVISSLAWNNSGRCLDLPNGNLSSGNQVQVWACNGAEDNNNQIWDTGYM